MEAAIIAVAWLVSLFVALFIVPKLAGKKSKDRLVAFLSSEDSDPLWDKAADRVMVKIEPRLSGFEDRLNQPIQLDLAPIVAQVTANVGEQVEKVRAVIDGKLGWARKVAKQGGEAVAEAIGEQAAEAAGLDPAQAEIVDYMDGLLDDKEWTKAHPAAAVGLRILKRQGQVTLKGGGSGYRNTRRRR